MAGQNVRIGGFVATNSGNIENCYSVVNLKVKKCLAGGFAAENIGKIETSYCFSKLKNLTGGFAGIDQDHSNQNNYFLHKEEEGSKKLKELSDLDKGQKLDEVKDSKVVASIGFDTEHIWEYRGDNIPIGFIQENWNHQVPDQKKEPLFIRSADELQAWADKVNAGDEDAGSAYVQLKDDIDLGGKEWVPIGDSRVHAFQGIFEGNGHLVKNFQLKNKKKEIKGFFGYVKGEVYNLSIDCILSAGNCVGGFAAQNEGIIGCCSAAVSIKGKRGNIGGFAGKNDGTIFQSYAAGKIEMMMIPLWWLLPIAGILGGLALFILMNPKGLLPTFAPVPYDDDAVPIPDDDSTPNTDGNFVSFQFKQEITVDLASGECQFEFKNPGNSNHNIVVQLQFTDAQANRIMGSTGRSAEEQAKLEETEGYDPENYRTIIAESGAVQPGYQLDNLKLVKLENGAVLPPGTYNAVVYLVFYDIETNNRAMLESQLPVEITVS